MTQTMASLEAPLTQPLKCSESPRRWWFLAFLGLAVAAGLPSQGLRLQAGSIMVGFAALVTAMLAVFIYRSQAQAQALPQEEKKCVDIQLSPSSRRILVQIGGFLRLAGGSALLLASVILSLFLANSPATSELWISFWNTSFGPALVPENGQLNKLSLTAWVNEGFMSFFFFNVGLEIKRELVEGSLASMQKAALPCVAAVGGMIVPTLVCASVNYALPGGTLAGSYVPMATDIAFAMSIFSLYRRRLPEGMAPFLMTLATVDDLGAMIVVAVCLNTPPPLKLLVAAIAALCLAFAINRRGLRSADEAWLFLIPAISLWCFLLRGGVSAAIAGAMVAFCVPIHAENGDDVVEMLIAKLTPVSAFLIMPVFGLANCAVSLHEGQPAHHVHLWHKQRLEVQSTTVALGIALGLLIGKPLGIFGASDILIRCGLGKMPTGMSRKHLLATGLLGSIGFTMCLFLAENCFVGHLRLTAKLAVLCSSMVGALASATYLSFTTPARQRQPRGDSSSEPQRSEAEA